MRDSIKEVIRIFYSYAHQDEKYLKELVTHLAALQRQGQITNWHNRKILAGTDWASEIDAQINMASIILLLISPDFIASNYLYGKEMKRAMERHEAGEVCVIPIIVRPVYWEHTPFSKLQVLPVDKKPIVKWSNRDDAFKIITESIYKVIEEQWPYLIAKKALPIHNPYLVNLAFFQARKTETATINVFLRSQASRLLVITGSRGVGKTALIRRVCKGLEERGQLPDEGGALAVDSIIYMNIEAKRLITVYDILSDLRSRLTPDAANVLEDPQGEVDINVGKFIHLLLRGLKQHPVLLLLNNFELMLDETGRIKDTELLQVLRAIIASPHEHSVKIIVISAIKVAELQADAETAGVGSITNLVLTGFSLIDMKKYLRLLDGDTHTQISHASPEELQLVHRGTEGNPLALQALHQVLASNPRSTLIDSIQNVRGETSTFVMETLMNKAFDSLDSVSQYIIQALAVYDSPVSASAIDYLLQPYIPDIVSETKLKMLTDNFFITGEADLYMLHQVQKIYALMHLPMGTPEDISARLHLPTRFALIYRATDYFKNIVRDYNSAAHILTNTDQLLLDHEAYQLVVEQYKDLYDKLQNQALRMVIDLDVGVALETIGAYQQALARYEAACNAARKVLNKDFEASCLINTATIHLKLGNFATAISMYEQALKIVQTLKKLDSEWVISNDLGVCYFEQGKTFEAIQQYQHILELAERREDIYGLMCAYVQLGNCYTRQGDVTSAEIAYDKVLTLYQKEVYPTRGINYSKRRKYSFILGCTLHSIAELFTDQQAYECALKRVNEAIEIDHPHVASDVHSLLARIYLQSDRLAEAYEEAKMALSYPFPMNHAYILLLISIILMRKGEPNEAQEFFQCTINNVNTTLSRDDQNMFAYDIKALAFAGLSLCTNDLLLLENACETYNMARAINKERGTLSRINSLFGALVAAKGYNEQMLKKICQIPLKPEQ